jgi:hypothetical protein
MIAVRVVPGIMYLRRPVLVAVSLADLCGPASGVVELPLHLFWSSPDKAFSLDDPAQRREVYEVVLREARSPDDLAAFLNGGLLVFMWPDLFLPRPIRKAWEDQHPALRPAAPAGLLAAVRACCRSSGPGGQAQALPGPDGGWTRTRRRDRALETGRWVLMMKSPTSDGYRASLSRAAPARASRCRSRSRRREVACVRGRRRRARRAGCRARLPYWAAWPMYRRSARG